MPYQRKKDGKVIEEHGTKPMTAEQADKSKAKEIAAQNKQRFELEKERKPADAPAEQPAAADSANTNKAAASK